MIMLKQKKIREKPKMKKILQLIIKKKIIIYLKLKKKMKKKLQIKYKNKNQKKMKKILNIQLIN